jgi:L-arginine dehydrogenase
MIDFIDYGQDYDEVLLRNLKEVHLELCSDPQLNITQKRMITESGDCIFYSAYSHYLGMFGTKVSPFIRSDLDTAQSRVTSFTMLLDSNGEHRATLNASVPTALRSGASSAIAAQVLLNHPPERVGIFGTGPVGLAHARFMRHVFPRAEIVAFSPSQNNDSRTRDAKFSRYDAALVDRSVAVDSDLICLATSSLNPVITPNEILQASMVTSVGTNEEDACEIDYRSLPLLDIYCDSADSCLHSAGDLRRAVKEEILALGDVKGSLGDLINKEEAAARSRTTYYRATGLGIEDIAAAAAFLEVRERSSHD